MQSSRVNVCDSIEHNCCPVTSDIGYICPHVPGLHMPKLESSAFSHYFQVFGALRASSLSSFHCFIIVMGACFPLAWGPIAGLAGFANHESTLHLPIVPSWKLQDASGSQISHSNAVVSCTYAKRLTTFLGVGDASRPFLDRLESHSSDPAV